LLDPTRDLGQLADLIENAFSHELNLGGERVLRELRLLSRLGVLASLAIQVERETDGILGGYVYECDGRVVGNVTVHRAIGHYGRWQISNVAVLERYRGRRIGRRLMEAAIDLILRRGGHAAYLFVRHDNEPAMRLYRNLGFVELDRITDLERPARRAMPTATASRLRLLRRLQRRDGERLYELVSRANSPGQRWLAPPRRARYVYSSGRRLIRWLEGLLAAEHETLWVLPNGSALDAGLRLRARGALRGGVHRLNVWVEPSRRGQVEALLAQDVATLLSCAPPRPAMASLPQCEAAAIQALETHGFRPLRTLVLMKLDL